MTTQPHLLGLDLGTTGVKALLITPDGQVVASATRDYPLSTPYPNWSEQDPADWWDATCAAIRDVLERDPAGVSAVAALAISGQMHGATLIDKNGAVVRPCILWNDGRTSAQCDEIVERVGGLSRLLTLTSNPALVGFTAPKLLWVRQHEPEAFARARTLLLPKDYINYRLTGMLQTEVSDASGTLLFDVQRRQWSADMMAALDLSTDLLPPCSESIAIVGRVTPEAAARCGLLAGTPVVAGGADNACAAVGTGVVAPGTALSSTGTSGTIVAPTTSGAADPAGRAHTFCHAIPETYYVMGVMLSAGGALRWYRDALTTMGTPIAYDVLTDAAAGVPLGAEGLLFLPYLAGERTPHADPLARGVFFGLSLRHRQPHLTRAVLEGVTLGLRDSVEIIRALGGNLSVMRATGGGARSALWRQIQADVFNAEVVTVNSSEGPAFGAALLAGTGVGVYASVSEAAARTVRPTSSTLPQAAAVDRYNSLYALYARLYPDLRDGFHALAAFVDGE